MKKIFLPFLLFISILSFAQEDKQINFNERVYDPFFTAKVIDNEGNEFNISNVKFYDEFNDKNFFFWVRRNSGLYALNFKNIKQIEVSEDDLSDTKYRRFTRCTLTLVTGESYDVYLKTLGQLEGIDEDFGSNVSFYMHYNLIRLIEFNHNGDYWYCPFCETIYFNDIETCIYDKTPLIKGVLSVSEK